MLEKQLDDALIDPPICRIQEEVIKCVWWLKVDPMGIKGIHKFYKADLSGAYSNHDWWGMAPPYTLNSMVGWGHTPPES
ncbi:MAG: hypothetical protein JAY91_14760, partial [Candidatus Thiodiazotropha endolucinida]|nr:hypothetical protein [Candidatus Thiodiazotropha taylori]MCW4242152.1 hypothetical protein [Candidatus Thiodiazotropha taylori]